MSASSGEANFSNKDMHYNSCVPTGYRSRVFDFFSFCSCSFETIISKQFKDSKVNFFWQYSSDVPWLWVFEEVIRGTIGYLRLIYVWR